MLLFSVQQLAEHERKIKELQTDVLDTKEQLTKIQVSRNKAMEELLLVERSESQIPKMSLRAKIRKIINQYCYAKNSDILILVLTSCVGWKLGC